MDNEANPPGYVTEFATGEELITAVLIATEQQLAASAETFAETFGLKEDAE